MSSQYEPIGEESLDGAPPAVVAPMKRRKKRVAKRGAGTVVGIVALVILGLAIVVLAITLPIVFTRQQQQQAGRNADLSTNPNARSGQAGTTGQAPVPVGPGASAGGLLGAPGGSAAGAQVITGGGAVGPEGVPGGVAAAPVGPNTNTNGNVVCYRSAVTGELLPGAYTLTGITSNDDNLPRSEVRSCGSGSRMYLLTSQLVVCNQPCQVPVWMGVADGMIAAPIWSQQFVCRGDQVYVNQRTPRFTFYWRFAGFVQEQLIMRCDSDDAYWVPNIELRFCQPQEVISCQTATAQRTTPGTPTLVNNLPAGTVQTPRAVCEHTPQNTIVPWWTTGVARSSYSWTRVRYVDEIQIADCTNKTNVNSNWLAVDDLVPCPAAMAALCTAGQAQQ